MSLGPVVFVRGHISTTVFTKQYSNTASVAVFTFSLLLRTWIFLEHVGGVDVGLVSQGFQTLSDFPTARPFCHENARFHYS
jgi:hypothetical protein